MEGAANQYLYTVIMTEMCNLSCKYCYVPHKQVPRDIISTDVIDALIESAKQKLREGWQSIRLDLFGGEPLICWDMVRYVLEKVDPLEAQRPGSFYITIFTNATLLTPDILNFTRVRNYVHYNFSVDGDKECHNSNRVYRDGRGSFDDVMRGIKMYSRIYDIPIGEVSMMYMLAPSNIRDHFETMRRIQDSGMKRYYCGIVRENIWSEEDLAAYKDVMTRCIDYFIEDFPKTGFLNGYFIYPKADMDIRRNSFCSACKSGVGVSPAGDIYPCQRFFNNRSGYKVGDVFNGINKDLGVFRAFESFQTSMIPKCKKCEYGLNPGCMGQCFAACYENNGDIFKPIDCVCQLHKMNYEFSLKLYDAFKGNQTFQQYVRNMIGG